MKYELEQAFAEWYGSSSDSLREKQARLWSIKAFAAGVEYAAKKNVEAINKMKGEVDE